MSAYDTGVAVEPRFVCKDCGKRGADVRPHFEAARMGTAD